MSLQICICILAAGRSQRFGSTKMLYSVNEKPLISHAVNAATTVCPDHVYLVTGHESDQVAASVADSSARIIRNRHYQDGIGSSIAAGVRACHEDADAIVISLADQVLVSTEHLRNLIATWNDDAEQIVATGFSGISGPPVLFGRRYFDDLQKLHGDDGARTVLLAHPDAVATVDYEPAAIDIDTPADLEALSTR